MDREGCVHGKKVESVWRGGGWHEFFIKRGGVDHIKPEGQKENFIFELSHRDPYETKHFHFPQVSNTNINSKQNLFIHNHKISHFALGSFQHK